MARLRGDLLSLLVVAGLILAVSFLPPDTTLRQAQETGILRACVPDSYPPLVTGDADAPGVDVEVLGEVAGELGLRLQTVRNSNIGRDFNPRNWRLTRAQCLVIAGGVVDTVTTRGFLVVTEPHLETGWAAVTLGDPPPTLQGATVGFYAGLTGLDRLRLGLWLRQRGATVTVVSDRGAAHDGLVSGRFDVLVSEALTARGIAGEAGGNAVWLPEEAASRVPLGFGLWKGDLTLERAIERALRTIKRDGRMEEILTRYELAPIETECGFC